MLYFLSKTKNINFEKLVNDNNLDLFYLLNDNNVSINFNKIFKISCKKGSLKIAKWIYQNDNNIIWKCSYGKCFYDICFGEFIDFAVWFKNILDGDKINPFDTYDCKYLFAKLCESGKFDIAKWLYDNYKINIHVLDDYAFRWSIINGHFKISKWLYYLDEKINISLYNNYPFSVACGSGYLEMAKWIYSIKNEILLNDIKNYYFNIACINGQLNIAKWIYSITKNKLNELNDSLNKKFIKTLFIDICEIGYFDMVVWLYDTFNLKNIVYDYNFFNEAFNNSCKKNNEKIAKWLSLKIKRTNKIKRINSDIEINSDVLYEMCENGYYDIIKWLYENNYLIIDKYDNKHNNKYNNKYNDKYNINEIFLKSCLGGNLNLVKWLYDITQNIKLINNYDTAFINACKSGSLDVVQFIYYASNTPNIKLDISANNDEAFIYACSKNYVDIVDWISKISNRYTYTLNDDNDEIITFRTNNHYLIALNNVDKNYEYAIKVLEIKKNISILYNDINVDLDTNKCYICIDNYENIIKLECKHYFCLKCLLNWFTKNKEYYKRITKCALCRKIFSFKNCINFNIKKF